MQQYQQTTLYLRGVEYVTAGQYLSPAQAEKVSRLYDEGKLSTSWNVPEPSPKGLESLVGVRR